MWQPSKDVADLALYDLEMALNSAGGALSRGGPLPQCSETSKSSNTGSPSFTISALQISAHWIPNPASKS